MLVCTYKKVLLELSRFDGLSMLRGFRFGSVSQKTAPVGVSLRLAAVMVLDDFLFLAKPVLLVTEWSESEGSTLDTGQNGSVRAFQRRTFSNVGLTNSAT